jgi:hypothetical protein
MIDEIIKLIKENQFFVICMIIVFVLYCNKRKNVEKFIKMEDLKKNNEWVNNPKKCRIGSKKIICEENQYCEGGWDGCLDKLESGEGCDNDKKCSSGKCQQVLTNRVASGFTLICVDRECNNNEIYNEEGKCIICKGDTVGDQNLFKCVCSDKNKKPVNGNCVCKGDMKLNDKGECYCKDGYKVNITNGLCDSCEGKEIDFGDKKFCVSNDIMNKINKELEDNFLNSDSDSDCDKGYKLNENGDCVCLNGEEIGLGPWGNTNHCVSNNILLEIKNELEKILN